MSPAASTAVRARPSAGPATARPAARPGGRPTTRPIPLLVVGAPVHTRSRAGLVIGCLALLGVGLLGLLVLNVSLEKGAYVLRQQQSDTNRLLAERQNLQEQLAALEAPQSLARRAADLGMVTAPNVAFVRTDGRVLGVPAPGVAVRAPSVAVKAGSAAPPAASPSPSASPGTAAVAGSAAKPGASTKVTAGSAPAAATTSTRPKSATPTKKKAVSTPVKKPVPTKPATTKPATTTP
jgi:hypothetical protein